MISNCAAFQPHPQAKPERCFNQELRDNAAAYLLLHNDMSVEEALRFTGFADSEVEDLLLQKDVSNLVFNLRQNALSNHDDCKNAMLAARTMKMMKSITIRTAMQRAGFSNQDIERLDQRYKVLQCLAFVELAKQIDQIVRKE